MGLTSREEDILRATIDGTEYTEPPMSRVEELLIELKEAIEEGGGGGTGSTVTITPTLESGEKIADYSINGTPGELYAPEGGGTEVVANPEDEATDVLEKIKIGDDILSIPAGGFPYKDTLIFDTNVTSDGTFALLDSIDNYDALLISGYCAAGSNQPIVSIFVTKSEFYTQKFTLLSTVGMNTRRVFIDFPDDTHVRTDAIEGDISLRNIYGINFGRSTATYTEEVLFEETTDPGGSRTITLSKELRNFDAIYFKYWTVGEQGETFLDSANSPMYDVKPNNKGNVYIVSYPGYGNRYIIFSGTPTEKVATLTTGSWNEASYRPGVYQIVGVRYGNDESSPFKKDLLWSGIASRADNTGHLGKPITEYPFLMMYYSDSSVSGMNEMHVELVDTSKLTDYENNTFSFEYYGTAYIRGKFTDASNFLITTSMADSGTYAVLREIYGVDFGSGNGQNGSFQKDLLYAASAISGAPLFTDIPYLTDRNFFDYDLITLIQCNVIDTANDMVLSPCSFTPDELYRLTDGTYLLSVAGYKERYMCIRFSEHSFNITSHAAVNESGEYAPSIYKMYGFKFGGNGGSGKEISKYLPETYKNDIACEATLDNFDSTSLFWGDGPTPIRLSDPVNIQDGGVLIPVKSDSVFAYVDREIVGRPFTAYIVAKILNPDRYSRIVSTVYSHTTDRGIILYGSPINVSAWNDDTSTGVSSSDYFVGVIQYQLSGIGVGQINDNRRIWKPTDKVGQEIVIGRTDINPAGSDEEPSDIIVKYFAVVDHAESMKAIEDNIASLMERFNIS